tara:strand:+ start:1025 stop:1198 length:174 start_codon:yes stop_codon:yes gene_type:complete
MIFLCFATVKKTKIVVSLVGVFDVRVGKLQLCCFGCFSVFGLATGIGSRWGYCAVGA